MTRKNSYALDRLYLDNWAKANPINGKKMQYPLVHQAFWDQVNFVRRQLHRLFASTYQEMQNKQVWVEGTFETEFVQLPVYHFRARGIFVWARCDFDSWTVSVFSWDKPIPDPGPLFSGLFDRTAVVINKAFNRELMFGSYADNARKFTLSIRTNYDLYAFLLHVSESLELRRPGAETYGGGRIDQSVERSKYEEVEIS